MTACGCGCGVVVRRRFVRGHSARVIPHPMRRADVRAKNSSTQRRNGKSCGNRANWRGDAAGYAAIHKRMTALRTGRCAECRQARRTDMALIRGRGTHADADGQYAGRPYSVDPTDYVELCRSCHKLYDSPMAGSQ